MIHLQRSLMFICVTSAAVWLFDSKQAFACHEIPLCVTIEAQLEDAPQGTLILNEDLYPWKARGMRVTIIRPFPEPPVGLYLDQDGCTTFQSQFHAGFKLLVYPEAILGSTNNIRIKVFDVGNEEDQETTPEFVVVDPLTAMNGMIIVPIPHTEIWSLMAVSTHVIQRLDTDSLLGASPLTNVHDLRVQRTNEPNSSALDLFSAGNNAHSHKFLIGHELGHWIQRQVELSLNAEPVFSYYLYETMNSPCDFGVTTEPPGNLGAHGIRSAEHSNAAMREGFAHFVSSVAFNVVDNEYGVFRYYKEIDIVNYPDYADFVTQGNSQVQLEGGTDNETTLGGQSAWVMNQCEDDWDWPENSSPLGEEVTSEIDWMRFYWRLVTADEIEFGSAMSFWDIPYLIAYGEANFEWESTGALYCNLFSALLASELDGFEDRFVDLTEENGVYYDSPYACFP